MEKFWPKWSARVWLLGCLALTPAILFGQSSRDINWDRMQRDLDIMNGVLDKLLSPSPRRAVGFGLSKTSGVYFQGYGVVFHVDAGDGFIELIVSAEAEADLRAAAEAKAARRQAGEKHEEKVALAPRPDVAVSEGVAPAERVDTIKEQVTEFLGTYADAIGQLSPKEKISVLVSLEGRNSLAYYIHTGAGKSQKRDRLPAMLEASVLRGAVSDFRRGKLTAAQFRKRITFNERETGGPMDRNIEIFANILETALSKKHNTGIYAAQTRGIYLKGLGALFFLQAEPGLGEAVLAPTVAGEREELFRLKFEVEEKVRQLRGRGGGKDAVKEFKDVLVELVADYGHTLRTLGQNEHVVVAVDLSRQWGFSRKSPSRFILKAGRKDLDSYNRGSLSLAQFRKNVSLLEY